MAKVNYEETLNIAKEKGLILEGDKYCFCYIRPRDVFEKGVSWTIISKVDALFVVNDNEIKIYHLDQKTGQLLGSADIFKREEIEFLWASTFIVYDIQLNALKTRNYSQGFDPSKKFRGFNQDLLRKDVINFIKENYVKPYKEAKKAKKNSK